MADGAAVRLWRMGQDYWKENHQAIPKQCFDLLGCASALLESGLAVLDGEWVHVRGAGKAYEWLEKKKAAGAKGGKKSAQRSRDSQGKLQAQPKQEPSTTQAMLKQTQASYSYSSSSSPSSSPSPSDSNSFSKNKNAGIRIEYPEDFDQLWFLYDRKGDKKASFEEFKKLNLSTELLSLLRTAIKNYKTMKPDAKYRKDFQRYLNTDWREDLKLKVIPEIVSSQYKTKQQLIHEANDAFFKKQMAELEQQKGATNDEEHFDGTTSWFSENL